MGNESNENKGFNAIHNMYRPRLVEYARRITKNREDAEDVVQEVFLRFYVISQCENVIYPQGWLSKATKNRALNLVRDRRDDISLQDQPYILDQVSEQPDAMDDFFAKMLRDEILAYTTEIMRALKEHNKQWYDAVSMVYCMEIPGKEVADCLGMTRNAFDCMLQRTKKWIRKNYGKEYDRIMEAK